ncbi:MAG: SIS domain-containing protein [Prolixibacteraceae bacterium]|jgi:D-sedoheptulose 7-phosphate isomerase|nr:SIS domain-containing protein [Prolixibacteraceae bacterium]
MIRDRIRTAIDVKSKILSDGQLIAHIDTAAQLIIAAYRKGGKTIFCGNGGSAADAQHLAAELSGKFYLDRPPIPAEACHVNSSFITAFSNDFNFENAYARYIESVGKPQDVLVAISTSGNSQNVVNALLKARESGMATIAMTGQSGGKLKEFADLLINVPSDDTPRIQEAHILLGHIICEIVEAELFHP